MNPIQLDSKEALGAAWSNIGSARNVPDRRRASGSPVSATEAHSERELPQRELMRTLFRFARNAAVGFAIMLAVPLAVIQWQGASGFSSGGAELGAQLTGIESLRQFTLPTDATVTPMQAGEALAALQTPDRANTMFPLRAVASQGARPWRARGNATAGTESERLILKARDGVSADELAYLREVAEAPLWVNFDIVAKATAVDRIGAQFELPFRADAFAPAMPNLHFSGTKELAYAGVARAAYYVAMKDPKRAEYALRAVVSYGFALVDNAPTAIDAAIGRVVVHIGRDGLNQFYSVTGNAQRMNATERLAHSERAASVLRQPLDPASHRAQLLHDIDDGGLARSIRLQALSELSFASCSNVGEVLAGPGADIRSAVARASATLARFPSERAYIDMIADAVNRMPESEAGGRFAKRLVVGAAAVAGTVLQNPRLATCTRVALLAP